MSEMSRLWNYVLDAVRSPREKLSRGQQFVRQSCELTAHCWRQLQRHRAEGMAAELSYRTIFALIPVVVLGLVMFRIFGGLEEVQSNVENRLYSFFGVPDIPEDYGHGLFEDETPGASLAEQPDTAVASESMEVEADADVIDLNQAIAVAEQVPRDAEPVPRDAEQVPRDAELVPRDGEKARTDLAPTRQDAADQSAAIGESVQAGSPPNTDAPTTDVPDSVATTDAPDSVAGREPSDATSEQSRREARASIRRTLHEVTSQVSSVDFRSIGVFGLLLFIYAAVALADSTEHLFNRIYDAPAQRPIHIRVAIHWSIITLGSGLLAMSLYMSGQVLEWFGQIGVGSRLMLFLTHSLAIGAAWVLLFLLYALMPNTNVSVRAAAIGALVGALLWEAAKFGFQLYVVTAVPYSKIYGSIGLIPLFLFWIYVTWLIVLFGLILTYTLQSLHGKSFRRSEWHDDVLPAGDPDWMLPIMCEVAHAFDAGGTIDNQELANRIGLPNRVVHDMTSKLVEANVLRRVTSGAVQKDALTLARPAEKISIREILELAHRVRPTSDHPAWKTLASLKDAERDASAGKTLADVW